MKQHLYNTFTAWIVAAGLIGLSIYYLVSGGERLKPQCDFDRGVVCKNLGAIDPATRSFTFNLVNFMQNDNFTIASITDDNSETYNICLCNGAYQCEAQSNGTLEIRCTIPEESLVSSSWSYNSIVLNSTKGQNVKGRVFTRVG